MRDRPARGGARPKPEIRAALTGAHRSHRSRDKSSPPPFSYHCDLGCELQRQHDKRLAAISANNQEVGTLQPAIEFSESIGAAFDFDFAIDTQQRYADIAGVAATGCATKRNPLASKTVRLQKPNHGSF
jgi:hypothetical protein